LVKRQDYEVVVGHVFYIKVRAAAEGVGFYGISGFVA
jgi:hypothetical protein